MSVEAPETTPDRLTPRERSRIRLAADRAKARYPGPVGELVSRELMAWEDIGWRIGNGHNGLLNRLIDAVLLGE